jgi:LemA protein
MYARIIGVLVALHLIGFMVFAWSTHNRLVDEEHFLDVAHGRLLLEMQRKRDLLASCRNIVATYAAMEERIQDHLITLHGLTKTHGSQAQIVKNEEQEVLKLINELDLLVEKYPDLKSKGPYVLLMETIQETGFRIITERMNYNNSTYNYNLLCRLFPRNIVALAFGFKERPFLQGPLDYSSLNPES